MLSRVLRLVFLGTTIAVNVIAFWYLSVIGLFAVIETLRPPANGLPALLAIFFPFLFLPAAALIPFALLPRTAILRLSLLALTLLFLVTPGFGPLTLPRTVSAGQKTISVFSWNILADNKDIKTINARIMASNADIVAIQELHHSQVGLIDADASIAARYPYRLFHPASDYLGLGLLSSMPVVDTGKMLDPPTVWARIEGEGGTILAVTVHPFPGQIKAIHIGGAPLPYGFDSEQRDGQIQTALDFIDSIRLPGEPVVLVGDFNATEREPVYRRLTARYRDAHRATGTGPGASWKFPEPRLWPLGIGILRIDFQFVSDDLRPVSVSTDCRSSGSDHCSVKGIYILAS